LSAKSTSIEDETESEKDGATTEKGKWRGGSSKRERERNRRWNSGSTRELGYGKREREIARRRACEGRVEASAQGVGQEGDVA
jgi:hypothetical protein